MSPHACPPKHHLFGVLMIVTAVFCMAVQDATIKYFADALSVWQIYALRSPVAVVFLLLLGRMMPALGGPIPGSLFWVGVRSVLMVGVYTAFYAGVPFLPLSTIAVGFYTGPIFIVLLSALLLKEPVGRWQWGALACGFLGVLVILKPQAGAISVDVLLPVAAGLFYALAAITVRGRCQRESTLSLAIGMNVALFLAGVAAMAVLYLFRVPAGWDQAYPFLFTAWTQPDATAVLLVGGLALLISGVAICLTKAYQSAPASLIAPFDYSYLIFAGLLSVFLLGESPEASTWIGMGLILIGGLASTRR